MKTDKAVIRELRAALRKIEKNAHGGYLMGGSYVNACGCDRIATRALASTTEKKNTHE